MNERVHKLHHTLPVQDQFDVSGALGSVNATPHIHLVRKEKIRP
jgi:hypothetical protein